MRVGQRVRIVRVPEDVVDQPDFPTRTVLMQCLGKIFTVMDLHGELLALDVGEVTGKEAYLETIYIEPSCVEAVHDE